MKLTRQLASGRTMSVDVSDSDVEGAHDWFERLDATASALGSGQATEVELDWAVLRLEAGANEVIVLEPDYASAELDRFIPGVGATDLVFSAQVRLLQTLQLAPQAVRSAQYVRVGRSALDGVSAIGRRFPETASEFTGWQINGAASADSDTFGQFSVRELAHQRLAWIAALCLPTDWSFRFAGNTIVGCAGPDGKTRELLLSVF